MKLRIVQRGNELYSVQRNVGLFQWANEDFCSRIFGTLEEELRKEYESYRSDDQYPLVVANYIFDHLTQEHNAKKLTEKIVKVIRKN